MSTITEAPATLDTALAGLQAATDRACELIDELREERDWLRADNAHLAAENSRMRTALRQIGALSGDRPAAVDTNGDVDWAATVADDIQIARAALAPQASSPETA